MAFEWCQLVGARGLRDTPILQAALLFFKRLRGQVNVKLRPECRIQLW